MPRAFLVLNKKTKAKHKRNASDRQDTLTDENQNVQENFESQDNSSDLGESLEIHPDSDSDEDIEVDVCSVHEELIFPHQHIERDSVTSVSPGSSNSSTGGVYSSKQQHQQQQQQQQQPSFAREQSAKISPAARVQPTFKGECIHGTSKYLCVV